jgi:two-component system, OmpR family, sensor kinase
VRRSIHTRVVAAAGVAIALAVALLGSVVLAHLDDQLRDALDRDLRTRAAEVARLHATTPELLTEPGALEGRLGGATLYVQVLDRRARIVARSAALGGRVLPYGGSAMVALRERRSAFGDATLGDEPIRVFAAPLGSLAAGTAAGGAVVVAGDTRGLRETIDATGDTVLLAGALAALLTMALAAVLVRRAMRPLRALSVGVEQIERTGDAARRLEVARTGDEVQTLGDSLNSMLAALERARAVEQRFVADASHELRTPLTALRGNAAFIERHGADPEALADLRASAERLSALLDDLLTLAREDATGRVAAKPVDLVELAHEALELHPGPAAVTSDEGSVIARGDRAALLLALGNLIGNARRHGPPGGTVTIAIGHSDTVALISVSDEGPGLSAADAEKAFDRFWRADPTRPGSGLGLAIVRAVAERHGGTVSVDGPTFTLTLPLSEHSQDSDIEPGRPDQSLKETA